MNIVVRKNQHALDEYVSILFEMINSINEASFLKLARDAETGKVSRSEFSLRALEIEHSSVCQTRDLIARLAFAEQDIGDSELYYSFLESPNGFRDFVAYIQRTGSRIDAVQVYLDQYDANMKR